MVKLDEGFDFDVQIHYFTINMNFCPSVRPSVCASVQMNIFNTNEHLFPILFTCIKYNPPMNPVKFCPDQIRIRNFIHAFITILP